MSDAGLQSLIDAAKAYEALFVPALFGQWVVAVADAARIQSGDRVLDIGCGTGVLARETLSRTTSTGYVAGLDPSPGMLAVARDLSPTVDWREGTAESIPFPDQSFDTVVSQFGLMFFVDRHQALREMLRVLTPGGCMVVVVWDALDNIPGYSAEVALLERLAGKQAADAVRAPFVLGDRQDLINLFKDAGAHAVEITTRQGLAQFPSIQVMVEAELRGWLPVMGVFLTENQISDILKEAEDVLGPYTTPEGRVRFEISAHIVAAKKR